MLVPEEMEKAAWQEMQENAQHYATNLILPAAAASLLVMLIVRLIGGRRVGSLATLLAMSAGVFVSAAAYDLVTLPESVEPSVKPYLENQISISKPWLLDPDRPFDVNDLGLVLAWTLEEKPPPKEGEKPAEDLPSKPKDRERRYWVLCLATLAMAIEFLLPLLVSAGPGWVVRTMLALAAGRLITPSSWRMSFPWLPWAMGFVIVLEWGLLVSLARRWRDGVVPTGMGLCLFLAGGVLMLSGYGQHSGEYAVLISASLAGPALVSWIWPSDTSPALAACAVILPALMLAGLVAIPTENPSFWNYQTLAALAPLALLPMWLPFMARLEGWRRWLLGLLLPLIPAVIAAVGSYFESLPAAQ